MARFVLVSNGITDENFEKAMEVKIRSEGKISFIPQAGKDHGVVTQGMSSVKQNTEDILNSVRFEWNEDGSVLGAEIVQALAGHHHKHEKEKQHEPAA